MFSISKCHMYQKYEVNNLFTMKYNYDLDSCTNEEIDLFIYYLLGQLFQKKKFPFNDLHLNEMIPCSIGWPKISVISWWSEFRSLGNCQTNHFTWYKISIHSRKIGMRWNIIYFSCSYNRGRTKSQWVFR